MKYLIFSALLVFSVFSAHANRLLIPMDRQQANHLKAYGITYWVLQHQKPVDWLLNYRGGSFMCEHETAIENELVIRGITYEVLSEAQANQILSVIASPASNQDVMKLEKEPRIAVYSPKTAQPWDDAVTLALTYAEIPYTVIFDEEVLTDQLPRYDWIHLHHEDFTGQYGKFYVSFHLYPWYQEQEREYGETARKFGFDKVSDMRKAVALKIRGFVANGGFMFAMCSATDTYDIALASVGVDIVADIYDGDPPDPQAQQKLDFSQTFAFTNFTLQMNPYDVEFSNIDVDLNTRQLSQENDFFSLFEFSAKWDPVPTMLTQNHEFNIKGFLGATTAFKKSVLRPDVVVLGENRNVQEARYIHGTHGKGFWTFYGGHDPEDYQHNIGEEATDLSLFPTSPGYRLILNNVLFPAAKKKKQKT